MLLTPLLAYLGRLTDIRPCQNQALLLWLYSDQDQIIESLEMRYKALTKDCLFRYFSSLFTPLSVTLVISAYNEIGNLKKLLTDVEQTFLDQGYSLPVLVIDDGSTDGSAELLAKLKQQCSFLSVNCPNGNPGIGILSYS